MRIFVQRRKPTVWVPAVFVASGLMLMGCGSSAQDYWNDTITTFPNKSTAMLVGHGVCESLKDDASPEEVEAVLEGLGYTDIQRGSILEAANNHLCPGEGEEGEGD